MAIERIDVGCPGTTVTVNTDNPRQYSIENRCRCGANAAVAPNDQRARPHMYGSHEEGQRIRQRVYDLTKGAVVP